MIGMITFYADVSEEGLVQSELNNCLSKLRLPKKVEVLAADEWQEKDLTQWSGLIVLMGTGGVESEVQRLLRCFSKPVLLWATPYRNSLAATLEVYAALRQSMDLEWFYADFEVAQYNEEMLKFIRDSEALNRLENSTIGLIGDPSPWLLTSQGINSLVPFQTRLHSFSIASFKEAVAVTSEEEARPLVKQWEHRFMERKVDKDALLQAARATIALEKWFRDEKLNAVTVRCFDLLEAGYTLCMALSVCNDHGLVAGCEGDLEAVFSMLVANLVSHQPAWMANPARMDLERNQVTFSHCTIASELLDHTCPIMLQSHMESGMSVAIEGSLIPREITLFRFGHHFQKLHLCTGRIIDSNLQDPSLCRCQVVVELDTDIKQWMNQALGNHQVLVFGDWRIPLERICRWKRIEVLR